MEYDVLKKIAIPNANQLIHSEKSNKLLSFEA